MATTRHWQPNAFAASSITCGVFTAAVLIPTLSAPASSISRMSATVRMPPPTVSGMKQLAAVRATTSTIVLRSSWLAVMSRNTSSSAPCAL